MTRIAEHLAQLPGLAARTAPRPKDRDDMEFDGAGSSEPGRIIRPEFGPRLPPGLDLAEIDRAMHRQHSRDQLDRLGGCVRTVEEECNTQRFGGEQTWAEVVDWLLGHAAMWTRDAWCVEWIGTEVDAIRATLVERIERAGGWRTCALCGSEITTYATDVLDIAECQHCDRVISMREREALTTAEAARRLGISESAVRSRIQRGDLRKVGRRGKASLVAPSDGLDWARRKLGLIDDLSVS